MGFRNLPTDEARPIAGLIESRQGQVSSMALASGGAVDFMLMAFSAGESVSEEEYFGDTLYQVVEGMADVVLPDRRVAVAAGEAFMVPAHIPCRRRLRSSAFKLRNLRFLKRGASDGTH